MIDGTKFLKEVISIAEQAGLAILEIYKQDRIGISTKADESPITEADRKSNQVVCTALMGLSTEIPILSEESLKVGYTERKKWLQYWLVDPLDGTKEFINRNDDFTVNIALIKNDQPVLGVVLAPVFNELYFAVKGQGAFQILPDGSFKELKTRQLPEDGRVRCLISRSHLGKESEIIRHLLPKVDLVPMGSSLKFCHIANGNSDFYLRVKPTSEWDTAAAQLILEESGGFVLNFQGKPLQYNKESILNPSFVAFGDPLFEWEKLALPGG